MTGMSDSSSYVRSSELAARTDSLLLVIDVQERLLPNIAARQQLVQRIDLLLRGANLLSVPILATEQYPQGLGPTVAELRRHLPNPLEKRRFSSAEVILPRLTGSDLAMRRQVVVVGIETHVCVLQTAFDLLAAGYQVLVVADAVGSRSIQDRDVALARMATAGVGATTTESVLFEWCETAATAEFKSISQLVKTATTTTAT